MEQQQYCHSWIRGLGPSGAATACSPVPFELPAEAVRGDKMNANQFIQGYRLFVKGQVLRNHSVTGLTTDILQLSGASILIHYLVFKEQLWGFLLLLFFFFTQTLERRGKCSLRIFSVMYAMLLSLDRLIIILKTNLTS